MNTDFLNNFIWPLAIVVMTGIGVLLRKKIATLINKKQRKIVPINLNVDKAGNLSLINKDKFYSKIQLIKQFIRNDEFEKFSIVIIPDFKLKKLDKYQEEEYRLRLQKKALVVKEKLGILFYRQVDFKLENDMEFVCGIFENIIKTPNPNVTGKIKLDIYRIDEPKIAFPIYLDKNDFEDISKKENLSTDEFKRKLSIPSMTTMSIFNDKICMDYIYPALIWEIYRIKKNHNFSLNSNSWDSLMFYEVGLG